MVSHLTQRLNIFGELSLGQVNGSAIGDGGSPLAILEAHIFPIDGFGLFISQGFDAESLAHSIQAILESVAGFCFLSLLYSLCRYTLHSCSRRTHDTEDQAQCQKQCQRSFDSHILPSLFFRQVFPPNGPFKCI